MKKQTIWKYPLEFEDVQTIQMPIGAEILTAQIQDGKPCLWAVVDPEKENKPRFIQIFATGYPMPGISLDRKYIASIQIGRKTYHVFEYVPF